MLAWLGEWLQSIVAVILLAVVVELMLPNSKLLRYSRLVIGLILLLTMLSPILNIFQKDFQSQLAASFSLWDEQYRSEQINVPSLQEITERAEQLSDERLQASEQLTKLSLEEAMKQQLINQGHSDVQSVEVMLGWKKEQTAEQHPFIAGVKVTIKPAVEQHNEENSDVLIQDVLVKVEVDSTREQAAQTDSNEEKQLPNGYIVVTDEQAVNIVSILTSGWNVNRNQIIVQASDK